MFKRPTLLMALAFTMLTPHPVLSQVQTAEKSKLDDPAFKKWAKSVASKPAKQQVEAVIKKMQDMNPGYEGEYEESGIDDDKVRGLYFLPDPKISDISALRALPAMTGVNCADNNISDLTPLKDMKLKHLSIEGTKVSDLTPLKGMPLDHLYCVDTKVSDLTPLAGAPLEHLEIANSPIADLTPLKGMPLRTLIFTLKNVTKGVEVLRSIKTLQIINVKTGFDEEIFKADDFWKKYDAGGFKK